MGRYVQVEPNVKVYVEDIGEGTPVVFCTAGLLIIKCLNIS